MYRYKINVEYDGSTFCGWQKQKDLPTIQLRLETAIEHLTQHKSEIFGSGRTDSGVHAIGQVAHFDSPKFLTQVELNRGLNHYLKHSGIAVYNGTLVDNNFHARFSAKQRTYLYKIINREHPLTIEKNLAWFIPQPLNIMDMQAISQTLLGTHDFSTFRASGCQALSPIKSINQITIETFNSCIHIMISAPSFLYHQVRNIVGALYFIGCGKWCYDDFISAFKSCDRTQGAITAPPYGLYFYHVNY